MALSRVAVRKVGKRFGPYRALAGVDVELAAGEVCALLGPNGAGKSTLLGILSTLVRPSSGEIAYVEGDRPRALDDRLRREIGLLAHASLCYGELTAVENLVFFARLYGVTDPHGRAHALLDEVGLDARARERAARTYSRGMLQRLALARALVAGPSLLLLDEPFTGLDRGGALALGQRLGQARAEGAIVLVVTHDLEAIAAVTDHVVVLRRGQLAHVEKRRGFGYDELRDLYHRHAD
ncbi:MAG: ABC transporter ATP-binding protein [Kofleriaceae bacterium]|nr:ABC transporter ATP-binding protein [Kofleriaceae bacterium]MCL4222839.1 ABC transporter ATP-binding protein [Myxococcales bacterium]